MLQQFRKTASNLRIGVDGPKTTQKNFYALGFCCTYWFFQQFFACDFGIINCSSRVTEEPSGGLVSTQPVDEYSGIDECRMDV